LQLVLPVVVPSAAMTNCYLQLGAQREEQQHPLLQAQTPIRVNGVGMQLGSTHLHTCSGAASVVPVGWPAGPGPAAAAAAAAATGGANQGLQLMQQAWGAPSGGGGSGAGQQQEKAGRQRGKVRCQHAAGTCCCEALGWQ
jgi:hypothetical protein